MTRAQLMKLAPQFNWTATLNQMGLSAAKKVDVAEPSAVAAAGKRIADVPISTWKEYMTFRFISDHASNLPKAFDDARFGFYGHTLNDVPEQRARWKRGISLLDNSVGEAVGQLYVKQHWPDATARQAQELVDDVRAAYREKITNAAWMDDATRKKALEKLDSFDPRIGHPVKWIDYSDLKISRTDPLANEIATQDFEWKLELKRFPHPVDRTLWDMTPQTVNAYYDPTMNQITFPAAILQPPFFDANADPAVNYAETGATTIGHEMGHGFDDEGRQFDAKGRLHDWWTPATATKYKVESRSPRRPVRHVRTDPRRAHQGQADARRKSCRPWRPRGGICRLPPICLAPWRAAGHRRLHRRPALLHRLCTGVAGQEPRGRGTRSNC